MHPLIFYLINYSIGADTKIFNILQGSHLLSECSVIVITIARKVIDVNFMLWMHSCSLLMYTLYNELCLCLNIHMKDCLNVVIILAESNEFVVVSVKIYNSNTLFPFIYFFCIY